MTQLQSRKVVLALVLAGLNLAIGSMVAAFKAPLYLDSLGIFLASILLGFPYGALCAVATTIAGFVTINPYLPYYVLTSLGIAASVALLASRGMFSTLTNSGISGLIVAIVAATLSAPVTVYLFGGVTLSGVDVFTSFLLATGKTLLESVILAGLSSEAIDKFVVAIAAYFVLRGLPKRFSAYFGIRET